MIARRMEPKELSELKWIPLQHRPNMILAVEITEPIKFDTAGEEKDIDLMPGDWLAWDGAEKHWKLGAAEKVKLYREVEG